MDHAPQFGAVVPRWLRFSLWAAAIYNLLWGASAIFFPLAAFHLAGLPEPNYPELWQGTGMLVAIFGIGYALAANDPFRHWPVIATGLLSKLCGAIGFLHAIRIGRLPAQLTWLIIPNELIWAVPFTAVLVAVYRASFTQRRIASPEIQRLALRARTQFGPSLLELSEDAPVLLVFLRHSGCTFCREALADIAAQRTAIEAEGVRIAFVHMSREPRAASLFIRYRLDDVPRVSDPDRNLYRAFGLGRGGLLRLFGPKVWLRSFEAGVLHGHGLGLLDGDGFQLPGVFLIYHGEILRSYRHLCVSDRPNYRKLSA